MLLCFSAAASIYLFSTWPFLPPPLSCHGSHAPIHTMFRLWWPGRSTQLKLALLSLSAGHSVIKFLRCSSTFQKLLSSSQPSGSRKDSPTMAMSFMMKGGG